jgi:HEPN domain-containing protein
LPISKAVHSWQAKASRDLRIARALLDIKPPFLDGAAFFCQQAIEKSLKAFLLSRSRRIKKIRDLVALYTESTTSGFDVEVPAVTLATISEYAVAHRYPGAAKEKLTKRKIEAVFVFAKGLCKDIHKRLNKSF